MPLNEQAAIIRFLTEEVSYTTETQAMELVRQHYGITCKASCLASERDQNFHIEATDNQEYILKITHPAEAPYITNFHTEALLHIATVNPDLPVPHVYRSLNGDAEIVITPDNEAPRVMRLLSYMQGVPLSEVEKTKAVRQNVAICLAKIGLALRDFHHPAAAHHELLWDTKHAANLRELLVNIADLGKRELAKKVLDNFEDYALPILSQLRSQVIHNDLNPYNVLVSVTDHEQVAGIFDFGDMVHTPLIIDLAVAAAYTVSDNDNPLDTASEFIAAYHAVLPLTAAEVDVLYDLLATRLAMVVIISGWRAALYPENKNYILRNNPASWNSLERIAKISRADAQIFLRAACRLT